MNRKLLRCTNLPIIPYNASYKPWAYTQLCKGFSVGKQKIFVSVKKRALVKPVMVKYRWWTTHRRPSQRCHEIVTWSLRTIIQFSITMQLLYCFWGVVGCLLISRSDPYITTKNWCACGDFTTGMLQYYTGKGIIPLLTSPWRRFAVHNHLQVHSILDLLQF